jgi:hypothetical protein
MAKKREVRGVSRNAASALYYAGSALIDCLSQLDASVEPVDLS